jgi:anaerobic magnesium-protoporphyrin IX monomethyl ester cyclase
VNPQISSTSWHPPLGGTDSTSIRLGLAHLSASLKKAGHEVKLIDLRLLKGWKDYKTLLKAWQPEFLGVAMHTCEFDIAIECCKRAKALNPDIITILGGIHPTMYPNKCLETGVIDFVLRGEGEISFPKLIENPDKFPRSFWGETPDLNKLPFPDRDLWPDYEKRIQFPFFLTKKDPFLPPMVEMLTGRGCPWQCRFCCGPGEQNLYTIENKGRRIPYIRKRSVDNVMEELTQLYDRYKFKSIVFHDDQFVINTTWVEEFCEAMHNYGFVKKDVKWWAASRADIFVNHSELFAKMKRAGLKMLSVGFESFSDRILRWINKETTVEQNWEAVSILRKLGIQIYGNFMFGIPYSDGKWYLEDDIETVKAIRKIDPEIVSYSFFTPIPGSYLYDFCLRSNLILSPSVSLGLRFPDEGKIKNVDYQLLNSLLFSIAPKERLFGKSIVKLLRKAGVYEFVLRQYAKFTRKQ